MLSERIFYIIERISDILNIDKVRKETLKLCNEFSDDERKSFLDLCWDAEKNKILEMYSVDKIRKILELYSDDQKKEFLKFLKLYLEHPMKEIQEYYPGYETLELLEIKSQVEIWDFLDLDSAYISRKMQILRSGKGRDEFLKLYSGKEGNEFLKLYSGKEGNEFLKLYLPNRTHEFLKMYRKLSDDNKEEFLDKYNDTWRKNILKYMEFRQMWFQIYYEGTFLDLIKFLLGYEEGKEVVLSIDVKKRIGELQKELLRIYNYLRDVEPKYDDRQVLSEYDQQFYLNLSYLADSCDDFLDRVTSNDAVALDIDTLLETVHNSNRYNPSSRQLKFKVVVKDNSNSGGPQNIANMNLSINHSMSSKGKQDSRPKSFGHVPNRHLVGFNREIQMLLNHLIQPQDETRVVAIVGAGGSGKTTLAKHIYHHPQIHTHFTRKLWVCISQSWDKTSILNLMWRQVAQDPNAINMEYDQVVYELSQLLSSHSYLVILDDIWSIDAWYDISPALLPCSGSKVVVTTRNKFLPQRIDPSVLIVEPKQLNDEESCELFKRGAFRSNGSIPHHLLPLGMEMVKKCKGLPLAIVALAGVLGRDKRKNSWERISESLEDKILNMANESTQGVVKEILALSFYELPHSLKPCVLYLRVFPEDYVIEAQQLIQMWTAECFIDEEYVAEEYLDELVQRCIVEVVETNYEGQVHRFRIHDLIRQMFVDMNQERGLLKDSLRLVPSIITIFRSDTKSHARSLISLSYLSLVDFEFVKFRLLRVLIIHDISMTSLGEIGNMIHLRYIALGGVALLPESIVNLENLWTLDIRNLHYKWNRSALKSLYKLKELRHLYLPPPGRRDWGKIAVRKTKLKTLWNAVGGEWMVSGMPELSAVLQELCIHDIDSKEQLNVVFRTPSITSNTLHTLELRWTHIKHGSFEIPVELCDMSILGKCKSLKMLKLWGRIGVDTTIELPPNLIQLEMGGTVVCEGEVMNIISKSCPQLKILSFGADAYCGTELVFNANSFPQLEKLTLADINHLELWIIEKSAMPRLDHLIIKRCENMDINPEGWPRILQVPQLEFEYLSPKFEETLRAYTNYGMYRTRSTWSEGVSKLLSYLPLCCFNFIDVRDL